MADRRARAIMVQGTMSNVGKSVIATGLCRVFAQDGFAVAPFKSQNMALNSYVTADGGEMGRAQVVQAEACGLEPTVAMNPVLLKPVTDRGSQVIVAGRARGVMSARDYFATRADLVPDIMAAYDSLAAAHDIVVVEGAGSPAEINLRTDDIVNMGLARLVGAPVLLVGDIDRGGVFAQLVGTCALLPPDELALVKGLVINKFRGDVTLLADGLDQLAELTGRPVLGVVPYLDLDLDDEDSLSDRLVGGRPGAGAGDIAVIRLPKVSNFTDFTALGATAGLTVRYVDAAHDVGSPDLLVLPGTRNTIADLAWLRARGLDQAVAALARRGGAVVGVCGGYQMLGRSISDPDGVESGGSGPEGVASGRSDPEGVGSRGSHPEVVESRRTAAGLGLLPVDTTLRPTKHQTRVSGTVLATAGPLAALSGAEVAGYEIHQGETRLAPGAAPWLRLADGALDGCQQGNVYGTYVHGVFDTASARGALLTALGLPSGQAPLDYAAHRQEQYDHLADALRAALDIDRVYRIMEVPR
ncbi:MAG: cobyric acid synthase [Propionibacteriaceae bacterium]|jgi:adenosylcobyric acid synthase|nr:cobyric acid synthase [Propionibacteriaceae bacterium]